MVTGSSERDGGTETAVIARDPNMKVTTFSMGEETMLECHYKFGIYEEQRREPRQTEPGDNPSTAQDFPETSSITSASSLGSDRKSRSNSIQFGFSNRKKKKKKPVFEPTEIDTIEEREEQPTPTSEPQVESDDSDSYTMDCTGTTGIKISVDTREMKRKLTEKRENFRNSLSWTPSEGERRNASSFEAGIKLGVRPKTEEEIFDKKREEERTEAVRKQQKKELFRLNEKTMEWVPPESANQTEDNSHENQNNETMHDADCLQSFCLYLKLQLSQFSHFSVRTVSPDLDDTWENEEAEKHSVVEETELDPPEAEEDSPPPIRRKESRNSKPSKRRDSGIHFGFGTKRPRKKSADSLSLIEDEVENEKVYEVPEQQLVEQIEEKSDEKLEILTESSSVNFMDDFWETTKEAYGVQKSGAEVVIERTRQGVSEGTSTVVDKTLEIKDRTLERTKDAANNVYETSVEIKNATLERTKRGATVVVDKTVEGTNVVVDKTLEGANVVLDTTIKGTEVVVDKTVEIANKTVSAAEDATKDIKVHPFGKRRSQNNNDKISLENENIEEDIVVEDNKKAVPIQEDEKSDDIGIESNLVQPEVRIEEEPAKSEKKKRRKSSVISFGFGNKNKRKDSTKSPKGSSRTSSRSSLQMETVPEMEIVEEKEEPPSERSEPLSHKSEPISQHEMDVESLGRKSSNSSNIIESFIVTTKEAFGTTKIGAEKVIDKTVEVKNSFFDKKDSDKHSQSVQNKTMASQQYPTDTDKGYTNVPTGDAHLQRLWKTLTGENRFENEKDSDNEYEVTNDYENLPRSNHHYGYRSVESQSYTVPESRYNEIIEPPPQTPPPPPSSSSPSSSSSSAFQHEPDDEDHVYVNTAAAAAAAEDRQEKARARWKFWKREQSRAKINQPLSHTNNTGWVDY